MLLELLENHSSNIYTDLIVNTTSSDSITNEIVHRMLEYDWVSNLNVLHSFLFTGSTNINLEVFNLSDLVLVIGMELNVDRCFTNHSVYWGCSTNLNNLARKNLWVNSTILDEIYKALIVHVLNLQCNLVNMTRNHKWNLTIADLECHITNRISKCVFKTILHTELTKYFQSLEFVTTWATSVNQIVKKFFHIFFSFLKKLSLHLFSR